ncbi:GNAT family N-acetyltransferase [Bacillus subtilis subsp. subtilis]|nr:GNAT family N-acetyltransferase [Bacillus subtilis subsp. subtilis]
MSLQIRRARPADAPALSNIAIATYTETFGDSYPPQDLHAFLQDHYSQAPQLRELQDPRSAVWLLEDDGRAVGYLAAGANTLPHAEAASGDVELKRLYVLASHQGGGHGARLMDTFMAWLDQPARRTLWVGVWSENLGAQRFYARYGCVQVGTYDFVVGDSRDLEFILRRP